MAPAAHVHLPGVEKIQNVLLVSPRRRTRIWTQSLVAARQQNDAVWWKQNVPFRQILKRSETDENESYGYECMQGFIRNIYFLTSVSHTVTGWTWKLNSDLKVKLYSVVGSGPRATSGLGFIHAQLFLHQTNRNNLLMAGMQQPLLNRNRKLVLHDAPSGVFTFFNCLNIFPLFAERAFSLMIYDCMMLWSQKPDLLFCSVSGWRIKPNSSVWLARFMSTVHFLSPAESVSTSAPSSVSPVWRPSFTEKSHWWVDLFLGSVRQTFRA